MENHPIATCGGFRITENDLKSLTVGNYINDSIINAILKLLHRNLLNDEQQKKVHIFDTFFVQAIQKRQSDYIQRWLWNIFDNDYLMIPVNLGSHWFLMIIIHPNKFDSEDHSTCIQVMDSMGVNYEIDKKEKWYTDLLFFLQAAVAVNKHKVLNQPSESFPIVPIDVELQKNSTDCGIHLLMNAEKFLIEKYHTFSCQLSRMSDKRAGLIKLIQNDE